MLKPILAASILLGSISFASAMPVAGVASSTALPVVKAAIIVKRVIRRPPPRRVVVRRTIIRR